MARLHELVKGEVRGHDVVLLDEDDVVDAVALQLGDLLPHQVQHVRHVAAALDLCEAVRCVSEVRM